MSFQEPAMLWGLLGVLIPVAVHLFGFRRVKRILFPNVRWLQEAQEQTRSERRLRHLLVLAMRCLAVAALALAFAQPFVPQAGQVSGAKLVGIYIDNSLSMQGRAEAGTLLDEAREAAARIAQAHGINDRFVLLTNAFEGREARVLTRPQMLDALAALKTSPTSRTLPQATARLEEMLSAQNNGAANPNRVLYMLTDAQASTAGGPATGSRSTSVLRYIVPIGSSATPVRNLYVDTAYFLEPPTRAGERAVLAVRTRLSSNTTEGGSVEPIRVPLRLEGAGRLLSVATPELRPGDAGNTSRTDTLSFTVPSAGALPLTLTLSDPNVPFDDIYYLSAQAVKALPVVHLIGSGSGGFVEKAMAQAPALDRIAMSEASPDYGAMARATRVISEGAALGGGTGAELAKMVRNGGTAVLFPPADAAKLPAFNEGLSAMGLPTLGPIDRSAAAVGGLALQDPLWQGVFERTRPDMDLPTTTAHYNLLTGNGIALMALRGGSPLVVRYTLGRGNVYVSAVALAESFGTLQRHALFFPLIYKSVTLQGGTGPAAYRLGRQEPLPVPVQADVRATTLQLRGPQGTVVPPLSTVDGQTVLTLPSTLVLPGHYALSAPPDTATQSLLALNYDRAESNLSLLTPDALEALARSLGATIAPTTGTGSVLEKATNTTNGQPLWKWLLGAALAALALETLLLRLPDTANRNSKPAVQRASGVA